jgi:hypothetical protein
MKQFLRTVNTEVAMLAQQRNAEVLALAFKQIDDRLAALQAKVDSAVRAKKFLNHRMNEHHQAKLAGCTCELCEIYKEIVGLQACRRNATYPYQLEESMGVRPYVRQLDKRLFQLHNMRRELMGLPLKTWAPNNKWRFHHESAVPLAVFDRETNTWKPPQPVQVG